MDKKSAHKGTNVMPTATMVTSCQWCLFLKFPVSPLLSAANHKRDSLRKECTQLHAPMQSDVAFAYSALGAKASNCMSPCILLQELRLAPVLRWPKLLLMHNA